MTTETLQQANQIKHQIEELTKTKNEITGTTAFKLTHVQAEREVEGNISIITFPLKLINLETVLPDILSDLETQISDLQRDFDNL